MLAINIISPTPTTAALPLDKAGINVCRSDQRDITKASQKASSPSRRVSEWTSLVREIELSTQALACAQDAPSPATFRYWMRQYADLYATLIERVLESSHSWNIHNITSATQAIRTAHSCILESTDKPLTPERLQRLFSEALMEIADLRLRILVIHTAVPASGPTEFLARLTCPPTHRRLNTTQATPSVLAASSAPSHAKVVMEVDPRFALMGAGERPRIRAATFAGMVQHLLTVGAVLDPEYETLFFVFLPSFADASTLVRSLIDAYAGACEDTRMQLRVGKVFLKWATQHWRPARDAVAEDAVRVFATGTLRADHPTLSYEVTAALDQLYLPKQRDRRRSRLSLLASSRPLPKPKALIVPRIFLPRLPARRRDVRPALHNLCAGEGRMQLARQLTYFAQERWQGVLPEDAVLHHFCGAAQDLRVGEHLKEITNCAARLGVWVRRSVANVEGERLARRAFKLWTSVAKVCAIIHRNTLCTHGGSQLVQHCFSMHNYYFGRTIIDVLKETCVLTHLKKVRLVVRFVMNAR